MGAEIGMVLGTDVGYTRPGQETGVLLAMVGRLTVMDRSDRAAEDDRSGTAPPAQRP